MKIPAAVILTLILMCSPIQSREGQSLWPEGKVPHVGKKPVMPELFAYPASKENNCGAAVVICPGGGYGGLAGDHEGHQPAQWFNDLGVSAFVLHYRLGSQGTHYPAQLADVQRAIRTVRAQADTLGVDPSRIAVMGFSAGGHLASMAATLFDEKAYDAVDEIDEASARPDLAILCYPVISMERGVTHGGSRRNLLGPDRENDDALAAKLSSENNVTENTPPTFLFQTDEDAAVPAENAIRFYLAMRKAGVPAELHSYQDGPHGVGLYRGDPVLGTWSGLLKNWLQSRGFFSPPGERVAVKGEITLDGQPISWGVIAFRASDSGLPIASARIRGGKFAFTETNGPAVGNATITLEGSIWEKTGDTADRAVILDSISPDTNTPVEVEVSAGMAPVKLDFRSR